jgi:hypothetical protein
MIMATGSEQPQERKPSAAGSGQSAASGGRRRGRGRAAEPAANKRPERPRGRLAIERLLVRLVGTGGVIGVGVALGAILHSSSVQGWIIGLVVAIVSVILSGILWSSRQL